MKLLALYNGNSQNELEHLYSGQNSICDDVKLRQLIERDSLCARKNVGFWTIVHELVTGILKQKGAILYYQQPNMNYDLNSDGAPILSLVVEVNAGYKTSIAFGLSNKENNHMIRLAVEAVQRNIPCNEIDCMHEYEYMELPNSKGFMRARREHFKNLRIDDHYHYPISIAFKIVGQSQSVDEALKLEEAYQLFIKSLPFTEVTKEFL
ncbi:35591_t:CDS:2, partial [Racocetra persica]